MVDISVLFGADRDRATKELKESLEFEIKLANVSKTKLIQFFYFHEHYNSKQMFPLPIVFKNIIRHNYKA